jgi:uncharacterized protein (TIGR00369 family)
MTLWKRNTSISALNAVHRDTAAGHLGIEFIEVGLDYLSARMPLSARSRQPYGLLHGGISVTLAETLGTCGAALSAPEGYRAVGVDINANHVRGVSTGAVTGTARPVHRGRTTQVWQVDITNDAGDLICVSRVTMAMLAPREG